jgi:hypothetical protein
MVSKPLLRCAADSMPRVASQARAISPSPSRPVGSCETRPVVVVAIINVFVGVMFPG